MPVKKNFEYSSESDLKNLIKSGLLKFAVIFGDEHFMIKRFISNIVSMVEICSEFNISKFEGEAKMQSVYDAVTAFPMMSDKKVVILRDFDFAACGHALCIIDSRASHADLTDEYAAIPGEIKAVDAMKKLDLKKSSFYKLVKEYEQ